MNARDLAYAVDDSLQVLQVGDFENDIDIGLPVGRAGLDVANVGMGIADDCRDLLEHAKAVITKQCDFYRVGDGLALFIAGPENVDATLGLIQKIGDVGAVDGVDGNALAARDVAND